MPDCPNKYFYSIILKMDDKEYYSLMNRSSSWALQQALKKQNQQKQKKPLIDAKNLQNNTFTNLELRQGKADAEMLMEKSQTEKTDSETPDE